jgi:putative exporter of polyketide antibiotics
VLDISPFACQKTPALPVSAVAVAALLLVTAGLVTAGLAAFRRRDLAPE